MNEEKNLSKSQFQFFTEVNKNNNINNNNASDLIKSSVFQKEIIFFKNEILKDINALTKEISEKYEKSDLLIKSETSRLNELISNSESKIKNLTNLIPINNYTQELLDSLILFKQNTESYITTNNIRYANLERDLSDNFSRHDIIIKDSIIYPGVIGPSAQFKNFHELIDYFLKQITELLSYKEKSIFDFISYKSKLDSKLNEFKDQIDDNYDNITHFCKKEFHKMEAKINEFGIKLDELIDTNKIENEKNMDEIRQKNKEFMDKIEENIKIINEDNSKIKTKLSKISHSVHKENKDIINAINNKKIISFKKPNFKKPVITKSNISEKFDSSKNKNYIKKQTKESESKNSTSRNYNDSYDSKSKTSYSINKEIKNLETRLKKFIKEELRKNSNNNYNTRRGFDVSVKSFQKEINISRSSSTYNPDKVKKKIQKTLSHENQFSAKTINNPINIESDQISKRKSFAPSNLSKNIFEKFLKRAEENKKKYNFGKIKEVFIEESFQSSGSFEEVFKKENEKENKINKSKSNKSLTEEIIILDKKEFKNDINYKMAYKTTTQLPSLNMNKKTKKEKIKTKIEKIPEIINKRKTIDTLKTPIKRSSLQTLSSMSFSSRIDRSKYNLNNLKADLAKKKSNKNLLSQEMEYNSINTNLEIKGERAINKEINKEIAQKREKEKNIINIDINNTRNNNIESNKNIINPILKSPENKPKRPNPRLSNFAITLQGTKKFNLDSNLNKNYKLNSPTIYMNFPRKSTLYNERILESLHPVYRNKKFSNFITPYISLMTNNFQKMLRENDRKSIQMRKKNLPWNKSENYLLDKKILTSPDIKVNKKKKKNNYRNIGNDLIIKLNDENDIISFNKFNQLIMKDI